MISTLIGLALVAAQADIQVDGEGYLRFLRDGRSIYAKEAVLVVNEGKLSHKDGYAVTPRVQVNGVPSDLRVSEDGFVFGTHSGAEQKLGRLVLAIFPADVRPVVEDGFIVSSYRPSRALPGSSNAGVIRSGRVSITPQPMAPVIAGGAITITLHKTAEVEGNSFTLGEIADINAEPTTKARLQSIEISNTPVLSSVFRMSHSMVLSRIKRFDKNADDYQLLGATQIEVSRKGQTVTHQQLVETAIAGAKQELGDKTVLRSNSSLNPIIAPLGKLELLAERVTTNGSRISVNVAILIDGKRFNSRTIQLENHNPISKMRVGQNVKVLVISSAASVQTTGKIRSIDHNTNTVLVTTVTGAELLGTVIDINTIEVRL